LAGQTIEFADADDGGWIEHWAAGVNPGNSQYRQLAAPRGADSVVMGHGLDERNAGSGVEQKMATSRDRPTARITHMVIHRLIHKICG
ncbi:MAG: hypothetical protein NDI67_13835, partial [Sulfuritalea sp.]|nr:hypothetical protein [Sulfuritalea sp.]